MPYVTPGLREMMHQWLAHNITKGTAAVGLTGLAAGTLAGRLARGSGSRHLASSVDTDENYKALTQHLDGIPADEASLSPEDAKVLDGLLQTYEWERAAPMKPIFTGMFGPAALGLAAAPAVSALLGSAAVRRRFPTAALAQYGAKTPLAIGLGPLAVGLGIAPNIPDYSRFDETDPVIVKARRLLGKAVSPYDYPGKAATDGSGTEKHAGILGAARNLLQNVGLAAGTAAGGAVLGTGLGHLFPAKAPAALDTASPEYQNLQQQLALADAAAAEGRVPVNLAALSDARESLLDAGVQRTTNRGSGKASAIGGALLGALLSRLRRPYGASSASLVGHSVLGALAGTMGHNTSPGTSSNLAEVESNDLIQRARAIVNAHQEPLRQQVADRFLRAGVPADAAVPLADTYLSLPGRKLALRGQS